MQRLTNGANMPAEVSRNFLDIHPLMTQTHRFGPIFDPLRHRGRLTEFEQRAFSSALRKTRSRAPIGETSRGELGGLLH